MKTVGRVSDWLLRRVAPKATAEAANPRCTSLSRCIDTYYWRCIQWSNEDGTRCYCSWWGRCV